jgi:hypothetical protein
MNAPIQITTTLGTLNGEWKDDEFSTHGMLTYRNKRYSVATRMYWRDGDVSLIKPAPQGGFWDSKWSIKTPAWRDATGETRRVIGDAMRCHIYDAMRNTAPKEETR